MTNPTPAPLSAEQLDHLEALAKAVADLPETTQPFVSMGGQVVIHTFSMSPEQVRAVASLYDEATPARILALIAQARTARLDTTASASGDCSTCGGSESISDPKGWQFERVPCPNCAAHPVQAGEAVDERAIRAIVTKAREFYLGYLSRHIPGDDIDAVRADVTTDTVTRAIAFDLRATLAPVAAQQAAAPECGGCNDSGIIGSPPDQYETCPYCTNRAAKAPAAQAAGPHMYRKTALVKAEQFLPGEGKIPAGVISDGHGDPRKDPRYSFVLHTKEGAHTLRNGDYICTGPAGEQWNVERSIFESTYELAASPASTPEASQQAAAVAAPSDALAEMEARKDAAYYERNQVVAALAKCFPSGVAKTAIEGWSEDWHGCVYIDLPTGQVSWHFHDSQAHLFDDLPPYAGKWDGHDTPEKYRRVAALSAQASKKGA